MEPVWNICETYIEPMKAYATKIITYEKLYKA